MDSSENFKKVVFKFYESDLDEYIVESMWTKREGLHYKLDNIPFHVYQYSCDDIVETEEIDEQLMVKRLVKASGNSTFRVLFESLELLDNTRKELDKLGYESEVKRSNKLLAVNVPKELEYKKILNYLKKGEELDKWQYEESCISEHHQEEL